MESVFFRIICLMVLLSCSHSKTVEQPANIDKQVTTEEENLMQAVLSTLPNIQESQGKIVALLNQSLVTDSSSLLNIEDSQANLVALLNQSMVTSNSTLRSIEDSQGKLVALLNQSVEQNKDILETMATMSTSLQRHDEQIANLTSTLSVLLVNVARLLQDHQNVPKTDAVAELASPGQLDIMTTESPDHHDTVIPESADQLDIQTTASMSTTSTESPSTTSQGKTSSSATLKRGLPALKDCQDLTARGSLISGSGSYLVSPSDGMGPFRAFCDMETNGGEWTVIQKRYDGSLDFNKGWNEYEQGFGDVNGEHWMGLRNIRRLVSQVGTSWVLRIDLESFDYGLAYAVYDSFMIGDAASNYTLSVGSYSGIANDAIKDYYNTYNLNGMQFSTYDRDNDACFCNCAHQATGGWWYNNCHAANLNGPYLGASGDSWKGMVWKAWKEWKSLKRSEMKIRRV